MLFRIDPAAAEPLFAQLAGQVRAAVAREELVPGERLPPARDLAHSLDINVHTVLRGYQELRDEGLIDLRQGRGAVVTTRAAADYAPLRAAISQVVSASRALGLAPETTTALVKDALLVEEAAR